MYAFCPTDGTTTRVKMRSPKCTLDSFHRIVPIGTIPGDENGGNYPPSPPVCAAIYTGAADGAGGVGGVPPLFSPRQTPGMKPPEQGFIGEVK